MKIDFNCHQLIVYGKHFPLKYKVCLEIENSYRLIGRLAQNVSSQLKYLGDDTVYGNYERLQAVIADEAKRFIAVHQTNKPTEWRKKDSSLW